MAIPSQVKPSISILDTISINIGRILESYSTGKICK